MVNNMSLKIFNTVLLALAVMYSQTVCSGTTPAAVVKTTAGYVGAVGVVTNVNGHPILAEFGSDGLIVRVLGPVGEGTYKDVSILSASTYRAMQVLLQTYLSEHGESGDRLAVGARLMPAAQYSTSLDIRTNTRDKLPVTLPALKSNKTRSVLVIDERKILTARPPYEAVVLMEFPVDLSASANASLSDNDLSLLINGAGQIVYKSAYDISYKVDFYKDQAALDGFKRLWAPVGGMPIQGVYGSGSSFPDGKYVLTEIWPACPGFTYTYSAPLTARVYYSNFNPKTQTGGVHYVPVVKPGFAICSGLSATLSQSTNLAGLMAASAIGVLEAGLLNTNIVGDQDFNIPVVQLYAFAQLENVELGPVTQYQSDDAAIPILTTDSPQQGAAATSQYRFDFDGDGRTDTVVANPADASKVDIYLANKPVSDEAGNRNPPDLTRLADHVLTPQLLPQGLLKTISKADLEDTDVYVYRESTGQLLSSVEGLAPTGEADVFIGDGGGVGPGPEAGFNYSTLIVSAGDPGQELGAISLFDRTIERRPWTPSVEGSSGFPNRKPDFLRVGEVVRVIAINRKTGYLGSSKIRLASLYSELENSTANDMILRPPNLKVIATRDFKAEAGLAKGEHLIQLIGSEGAGLTSDNFVKIQTVWLDEDGSVLPEDLPGYTGRLAISTGNSTKDFSGNFEIKPGYQTQVVQLNNAAELTTEHFYVQVVGEHINGNPSFESPGAGPGKLQTRPAKYVPIKAPVYNELATLDAQNALRDAIAQGASNLPDKAAPVYHWVYRPEMQFSVYSLKVRDITLQGGPNNAFNNSIIDLTNPVIGSDSVIDVFLTLLDPANSALDFFGPGQDLVLSIAGDEYHINTSDGNEQHFIELDTDYLSQLSTADFLTISIFMNNDAANVLWQFGFNTLDLDADSDNNNGLGMPDQSPAEELIDADLTQVGKILRPNTGDADDDGIPNYADFNPGRAFAPLIIVVPEDVDIAKASIKLSYQASSPSNIEIVTSNGETSYTPAPGYLRIWNKNGTEQREPADLNNSGNFVMPEISYPLKQLTINNKIIFYMEAIRTGDDPNGLNIIVSLDRG